MQPNQELNALIITDESHRRHKELQSEWYAIDDGKDQDIDNILHSKELPNDNEEDAKAKEENEARCVP